MFVSCRVSAIERKRKKNGACVGKRNAKSVRKSSKKVSQSAMCVSEVAVFRERVLLLKFFQCPDILSVPISSYQCYVDGDNCFLPP